MLGVMKKLWVKSFLISPRLDGVSSGNMPRRSSTLKNVNRGRLSSVLEQKGFSANLSLKEAITNRRSEAYLFYKSQRETGLIHQVFLIPI